MHKRSIGIAGILTTTILVSSIAVGTPVFAGTTQAKISTADDTYLENTFSNVTFDNYDVGFAVQNTVAQKVTGQSYYAVTSEFPLNYRIYFNQYRQGSSGDRHAFSAGTLVYKIEPSGGGTTDESKWPFPGIGELNQTGLQTFVTTNITNFRANKNNRVRCNETGNSSQIFSDAKEGILTWRDALDFHGDDSDRPYYNYETDNYGHSYQTSNLQIDRIEGKPGDKLKVTVYQFLNNSTLSGINKSTLILNPIPWDGVSSDDANVYDGVHIESGYIYIPYTLTYDSNGGGTAPTPDELYTCDHNSVTLPTQGSMFNGDSRLLGWSETKVDGTIDASEAPSDLKAPGSTFAINKDMKLYAVWGTPASEATPSLSKRVLQSGSTLIPDMSFTFKFEQLNEWDGVNYVSTAAPIANQTVTVNSSSPRLTTDPFVGDLTGKTLYEGKIDNVLNGYSPTAAGTYAYKVSEVIPDPKAEGVSYTNSEFIMLVEVEDTPSGLKPVTVTNILYKDSQGNTKDQYTTPPAVFDEKHELIFYNNYGTDGGTTPTGIITNNLPFIVIIAGAVGGAVAATVIKAKKRTKR